jgi:Reverse transcriptase (RNA-dependent DNA polymerase)
MPILNIPNVVNEEKETSPSLTQGRKTPTSSSAPSSRYGTPLQGSDDEPAVPDPDERPSGLHDSRSQTEASSQSEPQPRTVSLQPEAVPTRSSSRQRTPSYKAAENARIEAQKKGHSHATVDQQQQDYIEENLALLAAHFPEDFGDEACDHDVPPATSLSCSTMTAESLIVEIIHVPKHFNAWKRLHEHHHAKKGIFEAMKLQIDSLMKMRAWDLVQPPDGAKILPGSWVYDAKYQPNGSLDRYRARWVVDGSKESKEGQPSVYAAVANLVSLRIFLLLVTILDLECDQLDVTTAFLHALINDTVYMVQPHGFNDGTGRVCRLNRALYGLRRSPQLWYMTLVEVIVEMGYKAVDKDVCLFYHTNGTLLLIYVDDILIAGSRAQITAFKEALGRHFSFKDGGAVSQFLGFQIKRDRANKKLWLSQKAYADKTIELSFPDVKNPTALPMDPNTAWPPSGSRPSTAPELSFYPQMLGKLWWLTNGTRPDLAFVTQRLAQGQHKNTLGHLNAMKKAYRYLHGTRDLSLCFNGKGIDPHNIDFCVYADASHADNLESRRSTAGYVVMAAGTPIAWKSSVQKFVATSTFEAEFCNMMPAIKALVWIADLLEGLGYPQKKPLRAFSDSMNTVDASKHPQLSSKLRHIDIKFKWVLQSVQDGVASIEHVTTDQMIADGLTKPLPAAGHQAFIKMLGLVPFPTSDA